MSIRELAIDILFIGHSLVGTTMPDMLDTALHSQGRTGVVEAQIINGAPLRFNWDNSATAQGVNANRVLPSGKYEALVLTEAGPIREHVKWNDTAGYLLRYHQIATSANRDTQVFFYEIWPRIEGEAAWRRAIDTDLAVFENVLSAVNQNRPSGTARMQLIPAAQAMGALYDAIKAGKVPGLNRISDVFDDDIHLNDIGQYYLTMVQYAAITGDDPDALPRGFPRHGAPSQAIAEAMQDIAWRSVRAYKQPTGS